MYSEVLTNYFGAKAAASISIIMQEIVILFPSLCSLMKSLST